MPVVLVVVVVLRGCSAPVVMAVPVVRAGPMVWKLAKLALVGMREMVGVVVGCWVSVAAGG